MGISIKGVAADYTYWLFDIDGRDFLAYNFSSPSPLSIKFRGRYVRWSGPLAPNTSGFEILSSTTSKTGDMGEKQGSVEWMWAGQRYKSTWVLLAGEEIAVADPEAGTPAEFNYTLDFIGYVPYAGPTGGAVGTGIESDATKAARQAEEVATTISESNDSLNQALAKLAKLESQREIDVRDLQAARGDVMEARELLSAAENRATAAQSQAIQQMQQSVAAVEARFMAQLANYQSQVAAAKAQAEAANTALSETKETLAAANRALAASESQGAVNMAALNDARLELQAAREMLAVTESRATQAQAAAVAELRAQIAAAEVRAQAQVDAVRQAMLAQQQAPATRPPVTTPPATTPPATTPPVTAPKPAGSALPLIIGAAYLLLS